MPSREAKWSSRPTSRTISITPTLHMQKTTHRPMADPLARPFIKKLANTVDKIIAYSIYEERKRTNELPLFGCQRLNALVRLAHRTNSFIPGVENPIQTIAPSLSVPAWDMDLPPFLCFKVLYLRNLLSVKLRIRESLLKL